ncbi:MAG: alkaline phosphatase family protein [Ignavibacteriales bacterium]|nr:alkaline phosphatase family protein [Ignavibacteriales bacterium]
MLPPHVILIFLDGVGVGNKNPEVNPFFKAQLPNFKKCCNGIIPSKKKNEYHGVNSAFISINANMGIGGLPQSGTGQSALLTGVNCAKLVGKHFGPYLFSSLKPVVEENNIFTRLKLRGYKSCYVNAFPQQYFEYITKHKRDAAISYAWRSTGEQLKNAEALLNGTALSADITNDRWPSLGYPDIPQISVEQAAKRIVRIAEKCNFVLFEYFYTDHAGHSQSMTQAVDILEKIDSFIGNIIQLMDDKKMLLIITSDHGNIEDLSIKSHTRNKIPFIAFGNKHELIIKKVKLITDITPAILEMFM